MGEVEALLDKAQRSFAAATRLLDAGDTDFGTSRAYYGYFYVAEAMLLSKGLTFSRHAQVISQYGLHFARNEVLDRRFHKRLDDAFSLRQLADYSTDTSLEPDTIRDLIEEGDIFLHDARGYLARRPSGEHS
ncbi:MAG TPA: HEPN domain-containing protein [Rubrobacter sp.]|nr:HEPN domain-containing protein [Rubrobacter sp.]